MKYRLQTAFFMRPFSPTESLEQFGQKMIGIQRQSDGSADLEVFLQLDGPANASDTVSLVVVMTGRRMVIGPHVFRFSNDGSATLVFPLRVPLDRVGPVWAQIVFAGEANATQVCAMQIVPALDREHSLRLSAEADEQCF